MTEMILLLTVVILLAVPLGKYLADAEQTHENRSAVQLV